MNPSTLPEDGTKVSILLKYFTRKVLSRIKFPDKMKKKSNLRQKKRDRVD